MMNEILSKFALCESCTRRQGEQSRFSLAGGEDCFICNGLTSKVDEIPKRVLRSLRSYEFKTFSTGLILPTGIQEREDRVRSELRIRGRETIKSEFSRGISNLVAKAARKKVDRLRPDLTILVNMNDLSAQFATKPLFVHGRYTKPRGIPQRKSFCESCHGKGCEVCGRSGYAPTSSVESILEARLGKLMGSAKTKFTWLGSEDAESRVYLPGRPFVAELKSPRKRSPPRRIGIRTGKGKIEISGLKVLAGKPVKLPNFVFKTRVEMEPSQHIESDNLVRLAKEMKMISVQFRTSKGKLVQKRVHSIRARAIGNRITADIKLDGGLPVKRLVNGESVSPSVSELLRTAVKCQRFDIVQVWERGKFEFG